MLRALGRLLPYILRVRTDMAAGLACVLAATAISLVAPWVLKYVVDGLTQGISRFRLAGYALITLGLAVADGLFRYLMRKFIIGASRQIEYDLRNDFFAHLERLPLAYFQANRTGDLMSRAVNDLSAVRMMAGPAVMYFAGTALGFVIAVAVMIGIDARLTVIALLPLPAVTMATRSFGRAIHDRFERIQVQLANLSAVVQEALAGVRVVRAYRQEAFELDRFRAANDEYVERNRGLIRLQSAFYPSLTLCFGVSGLLVLWVGGRDVIGGRLTLGEFVAFGRYLVLLSWPLIAFGWVINIVQRGVASWERMLEVFDAPAVIANAPPALEAPVGRTGERRSLDGCIEVRHLTFRYPGASTDALTDVSFVVEAGRTTALVGATGAGKSTLIALLTRLHEPPPASIFVDGLDIRAWPLDQLRRAMGVVLQEPFLFSDTVGGNIAFGLEEPWGDPLRARVADAAVAAGLDEDVQGFLHGYDTVVGERGITLSGGQKQRLAIARALAVDPRILILDDALSAVDTATETAILRQLRAVRQSRTCLIVAHRISTVRDADEILVLAHGRIVERGTHDALVASGGIYADLHRRQLLEEEIAAS
jgi:ATP-binding cassette, subfamily B, multidrug efflux pump